MVMLATLRRSGGIEALSRSLDVTPTVAMAAVSALLPLVVGGFRRCAERAIARGGDALDLVRKLDDLGGGRMAARVMTPGPIPHDDGQVLAERIFTSAKGVAIVADHAAAAHGLDRALVARMLPLLTMLVGGYFAARAEALPPDADPAQVREEMAILLEMDQPNPLDGLVPLKSDDL